MTQWYDSRQQEIERRKQALLQQLNQRQGYRPDYDSADRYYAQLAAQQARQQRTVQQNDSKKKSLVDTLMKQRGGIWGTFQNKAKDLANAWSDNGGFDLGDIGDTMGAFTGTKPGDVFKVASSAVDHAKTARRDLINDVKDNGGLDLGDMGDLFKHTVKNMPTPSAKVIEAVTTKSKKTATNIAAGVGDVVQGTGQALTWLGDKNPAQGAMDEWGKSLTEKGQNIIDKYEDPYDKEFTWGSLLDPDFYATSGARSLPFMLSMIAPSMAGAKIGLAVGNQALKLPKLANLGNFGKTVVQGLSAGTGAHLATGPMEAAMEAGQVYDEALKKGLSPEEADEAADNTFWQNEALLAASQVPGFAGMFAPLFKNATSPAAKSFLQRAVTGGAVIGGNALLEGGQEVGQTFIAANQLGNEVSTAEWQEALALGGIMGGGMAAVQQLNPGNRPTDPNQPQQPTQQPENINDWNEQQRQHASQVLGGADPMTVVRNDVRSRLSDELNSELDFMRGELEANGLSGEELEQKLDDYIDTTEEGHKHVVEATERLSERLKQPSSVQPEQVEPGVQPEVQQAPVEQQAPQEVKSNVFQQMKDRFKNRNQPQSLEEAVQQQNAAVDQVANQADQMQAQVMGQQPDLRQQLADAMVNATVGTAKDQIQQAQQARKLTTDQWNAMNDDQKRQHYIDTMENNVLPKYEQEGNTNDPHYQEVKRKVEALKNGAPFTSQNVAPDLIGAFGGMIPTANKMTNGDKGEPTDQDVKKAVEAGKEIGERERGEQFPVGAKVHVKGFNREMTVVDNSDPKKLAVRGPNSDKVTNVWRQAARVLNQGEEVKSIETEEEVETIADKTLSLASKRYGADYTGDKAYAEGEFNVGDKVFRASDEDGVDVAEYEITHFIEGNHTAADDVYLLERADRPGKGITVSADELLHNRSMYKTKEEAEQVSAGWMDFDRKNGFKRGEKPKHIENKFQVVRSFTKGKPQRKFYKDRREYEVDNVGDEKLYTLHSAGYVDVDTTARPKKREEAQAETVTQAEPKKDDYKKPWEMSLDEFLKDEGWKLTHAGNKENKQAHNLTRPDGSGNPGGWVSGKNAKDAKANYHASQTQGQIRRDFPSVSEEAMKTADSKTKLDYEHAKYFYDKVTVYPETFEVGLKLEGEEVRFKISDIKEPNGGGWGSQRWVGRFLSDELKNRPYGNWRTDQILDSVMDQKIGKEIKKQFKKGDFVSIYFKNKKEGPKNVLGIVDDVNRPPTIWVKTVDEDGHIQDMGFYDMAWEDIKPWTGETPKLKTHEETEARNKARYEARKAEQEKKDQEEQEKMEAFRKEFPKGSKVTFYVHHDDSIGTRTYEGVIKKHLLNKSAKIDVVNKDKSKTGFPSVEYANIKEYQEFEVEVEEGVGAKPSKDSDNYQVYKNGDYVEWLHHEGDVKRGYVKGHAWHANPPGTQRPADTIRIEHEFEFHRNKAVHSLVDPDKTEITILANRPEQLSAEEFVKDRYRSRQDIDPNEMKERLKEAGYGEIPLGEILKWKVAVGPKASTAKKAPKKEEKQSKPKDKPNEPNEYAVGDWVRLTVKTGKYVKGQIIEANVAKNEYKVKPHDNVYSDITIVPDTLLARWEEEKAPKHSIDDRKYMSLSPNPADIEAIKKAQPPNILLAYDKWGKVKDKKGGFNDRKPDSKVSVRKLWGEIGYTPESVILDSGAFAFWDKGDSKKTPTMEAIYGPVEEAFYERYWEFDREEIRVIVDDEIQRAAYGVGNQDLEDPDNEDGMYENGDSIASSPEDMNEFLKYYQWARANADDKTYIMSFDKVGDPDTSWNTYNALAGLFENVIPTYHYGTDEKYLDQYVQDGAKYIALGGSVKVPMKQRIAWAKGITEKYPDVKFHMLGTMSQALMAGVPGLYSLDGSGWVDKTPGNTKEEKVEKSAEKINKILGKDLKSGDWVTHNKTNVTGKYLGLRPDGQMAEVDTPMGMHYWTPGEFTKETNIVTTQAGTQVPVEYAFVEAKHLITSHSLAGNENKKFPKDLQPRDRSSVDSKLQIADIARNLDPERLGENRMASDGAPIIGKDGVVESGNGRTLALMEMYEDGLAKEVEYREFIEAFADEHGLTDPSEMERPILVRRRLNSFNVKDRIKFVHEANDSTTSKMGATETALADAKKMKSFIHLFVPSESGEVNTAQNQEFIKKYINEVIPANDRREVRTKEGYLSQDGKERLERALFALAYPNDTAIARYSEDLDDNARTVTGAMTDVAAKMAVLNSEIEAKAILSEFDISPDVVAAFNKLVELRRKGEKIPQWIEEDRNQITLLDDNAFSDTSYELLSQFDKLKSRNKIRAFLANYLEYVMNDPRSQGTDMFGDKATKEEFLQIAIERMNGGGDLFELETQTRPSQAKNDGKKSGKKTGKAEGTKEFITKEVTVYRVGRESGHWWSESEEYVRSGFQMGSRRQQLHKKTLPSGLKLMDLRDTDNPLIDLGTEQEKDMLLNQTWVAAREDGRRKARNAILTRNGYDGYITLDGDENDNAFVTYYLVDPSKAFTAPKETPSKKKVVNPLPEDPSQVDPEHFKQYTQSIGHLVEYYTHHIKRGTFPTGNAAQGKIRKLAQEILGRPPQEDEWRDALEAAVQQLYQSRVNDSMSIQERIEVARELESNMKNAGRSIEQVERQQFSTPIPLAEIVHMVTPVKKTENIRDGAAGTGSLLLPYVGEVNSVSGTELSPRRAAILHAIGLKGVMNRSIFDIQQVGSNGADAIVGNPPFKGQNKGGGTVQMSGSAPWKGGWGDLGNRFLAWDLRLLKNGGRLTYIVSGGVIDGAQNREFRNWLKKEHTVLAMVKFPSGVYDTRGTKFPTGLIVVEKGKGKGNITPITGEYETLESLLTALEPLSYKPVPSIMDEVMNDEVPVNVQPNKYDKIRSRLDRIEANARKYVEDNKDRMNSLPLDLYTAVAIIGAKKIADGVVDFAEWSEQMLTEFGPKLRLSLRSLYVQAEDITKFSDDDWDEYLEANGMEQLDSKEEEAPKEAPSKADLAVDLKKMYEKVVTSPSSATNKVKLMEQAKAFANENDVEWLDKYERYLERVREAAGKEADKKAEQKDQKKAEKEAEAKRKAEQERIKKEEAEQERARKEDIEPGFQSYIYNRLTGIERFDRMSAADKKGVIKKLQYRYDHSTNGGDYAVTLDDSKLLWDVYSTRKIQTDEDIQSEIERLTKNYFDGDSSTRDIVIFKDSQLKEAVNSDEVVSNKGNGNTGAGNGNKNASVGRPGQGASSGSKENGPRDSDGGREGTSSTGAVHGNVNPSTSDGESNTPSSDYVEGQEIFTPLPEDIEVLDKRQSGRVSGKRANGPTNSSQSSDIGYVPRVSVTNTPHRGNVTEAPNMRFVSLPDEIFEGDKYLPHPKVIKGGKYKLSDVQIETIMAAKYNFENGKRGMLIADDTGMGKTAQQLGIAADAFHSGRTKRILIVTTKDQVATVNFPRDNEMLGLDLPITWMHGDNKEYTKKHGKTWKDYHFHGKETKKGKKPDEYKPFQVDDGVIIMSKTTFRDAQESVIKWLDDANGDVTIIMDESHEFTNGEAGLGKANIRIYNHFKDKAQYIYASATAAENIDGLEHMYGLHKWSTDGFGTFKLRLTSADTKAQAGKKQTGMAKSFSKAGNSPFKREIPLTMMEQITRELKMDGQYVGRSLSMEGVAMEGLPIKVSPEEIGDWNRAVQFIRMIAERAEMYGRSSEGESDPKKRGMIISQVVGYMRRISGYYRMKSIIADIQKQMDSGDFSRFGIIGEFVTADDGRPANLFAAINVINTQDPVNTGDDVVYEDIPEAIADKEYLLAILRGENPEWGEFPVPEIPTPMSLLYDAFGEENVAIVSGEVDGKKRPKIVEEFQSMKKKIIWFNSAGGTGVDMHDTVGTPIRVYTQDYAYNAKQQKQSEGRFHRTGQVTAPTFVYPYLNSSTDTKFVGTLIARYEAMGALSRGDVGKLGGEELANFDMTGEAAEIASVRIIPELDEEVRAAMFGEFTRDKQFISEENGGLDETEAASVYSGNAPEVKKFLNALMFLDYETSGKVYEQFTEKIKEVEKELEERGGVKDKFETYKGKELETQVGKNGIKLRKISTILTDSQKRKLDYELEMAMKNEAAMEKEYDKAYQDTLSKYEKQVEEITAKQEETKAREDEAREAYRKIRLDLTAKPDEVGKVYSKYSTIQNEYIRRKERLDEVKTKLKGLKDGNADIIVTIADMKRAQTRKNNARLTRMGAQANIERSQEILLIDGKIATNGLLVNIRQAIREAAKRVYGERNTPPSALTLELRGYELENGEKALGAVVPKWAEAEVAKGLDARMSYTGSTNDLEELKSFVEAGNKVSLQGGYELEYKAGPAKIIINGMTVSKDKDLYKKLNNGEQHIGFNPVARYFSIDSTEGLKRFIERFPILEKKASTPVQEGPKTSPGERVVKGYRVDVKTDKHTQTGEDIWLVKPLDTVPKDQWAEFAGHMRKHGGNYYGQFTKGSLRQFKGNFVFRKNPEGIFDNESTPSTEEVNTFIPTRNNSSTASTPTEETVTRAQIINHVRKEFKVPIGTGRYRRRALGLYKKVVNEIRMKNFGDFVVLSHELGHQLDNKYELVQDHNRDELIDLAESNLQIPNNMSEDERAAEGMAEFLRLYLHNRPAVMGMNFYSEFIDKMEDVEKLEALNKLGKMFDTWTGQSAEARVDGVTDVRENRKRKKGENEFYAKMVEELIGLKNATDKLKGDRTLAGKENPYFLAWRTRGTAGKIQAFMEHGIIDEATGEKIAPSFKEILEMVPDVSKFRKYLEAKHALTLHAEGKYKTPITEDDAETIINNRDGESEKYNEAAEALYEYQNYVTQELVTSGILKANSVEDWNEKYPFYVPFYRVMEESGERDGKAKGERRRHTFANSANPVKGMKKTGSARNIIDPLESIMKNTFMYLNLAQRNDVGVALTNLLGEDSADIMVQVDPKSQMTAFNLEEISKDIFEVLNDSGINLTDTELDLNKMAKVFRPFIAPSMVENIVTVWKNGDRKMYEVRDEELYKSLTAMDNDSIRDWMKLLALPNNILRTGITLSPTFIPKGPMRSFPTMLMQSNSYTTPFDYMRLIPDLLRATKSSITKDSQYWDWLSAGGAQSTLLSIEQDYFKNAKKQLLFKPNVSKVLREAFLTVGTVPMYKLLRGISQVTDESIRIAEYQQARRKGADRVEAAIRSRDVDVDFSRFGKDTKNINRALLFFNVAIQGPDRFIREIKNHPVRSAVRGLTFLTAPTLALMAMNYDDEDYWELEQWERDLFWNIPIGDGKFLKIPIPFEWGFAFKVVPERILQGLMRDDRTAFEGFFKSIKDTMVPTVFPTALIPYAEWMAEKDFSTWRSTTRPYDNRPAEEQANDYTTDFAKWLGKTFNQPATKFDQFAKGFAGSMGTMAMNGVSAFIPNEHGDKPSSDRSMMERTFTSDSADGNTYSSTKFYKEKDKLEKEHSKNGVKGEPTDEVRVARDAESYLSQLRKLRTLVRTDKTMTAQEKGDHITKINSAIRDISRLAIGQEPFDTENMTFYANYARENKDFEHEE